MIRPLVVRVERMFDTTRTEQSLASRLAIGRLIAVDLRLLPLNAFIGLCVPDHLWPSPLAAVGYRLHGLEIPVSVGDERVVIDAVAFRQETRAALAVEAKSGKNVAISQAGRYGELEPDNVIRSASITVSEPGSRSVQGVFVSLQEHVARILEGLSRSTAALPVLALDEDRIEHHGAAFSDPDVQAVFDTPHVFVGTPPRYVLVDQDSPDEDFDRLVLATLVEALSHQTPQIFISALAERAIQFLPMYGTAIRSRLIGRVNESARRIAATDEDSFLYVPPTGARRDSVVEFVRDPEGLDLRGRTQSYQAISRAAAKRPSRRRETVGQTSFDQLLSELDRASELDEEQEEE